MGVEFSRRPLTRPEKIAVGISGGVVALMAFGSLGNHSSAQPIPLGAESTAQTEPTPTHTPIVTVTEEIETVPIPFEKQSIDDANLASGTVQVSTPGVAGTLTITYRVTSKDGAVTSKTKVKEEITVPPVTEVTSVGTYVAPPPPPPPVAFADPGGCDSNYSGPCVPIASDVDCAGGSGNGPAYVSGPVYVVGSDIYDLDRDGDGVGCD